MVTRKKGLPNFLAKHTEIVRATLAARATARVLTEIQSDLAFDTPNVQDALRAATNSVIATYVRVGHSCQHSEPQRYFNALRRNIFLPRNPGFSKASHIGAKADSKTAYLAAVELAEGRYAEAIIRAASSRANAWKFFDRDVEKLSLVNDAMRLLSAPLYLQTLKAETKKQGRGEPFREEDLPLSFRRSWSDVKKNLIERGSDWIDWVEWYESRLLGREFDPDEDLRLIKAIETPQQGELADALLDSGAGSLDLNTIQETIRANPVVISVNAAALFDQINVEIDRVRSSMPNDPEALLEANDYLDHLSAIQEALSKVSNLTAKIDTVGNDVLAQQEVLSLHNRVVRLGEWLVGKEHARDAVSVAHFGMFTAFLMTCGVTPILASAVPAAVFLGGKLATRIKEFLPKK